MNGHERKMNGNERKMHGNERKLNGNERKMKGNEWKREGNERKMNGNARRMTGNDCFPTSFCTARPQNRRFVRGIGRFSSHMQNATPAREFAPWHHFAQR